ncbi:odorant receptor 216 [Nasonia vitripennis]|uniref:Odorant receptor n=1 Tax=Nasonia vitripennis TaxID=7425 RepID=A0A7M6UPX2_NASVI|nr:odorant receptor 216 [Nasonia vitripennis]
MTISETDLAVFDGPHYSLNKKLLIMFGLWPTLSRTRKVICLIFFTMIDLSLYASFADGINYYRKQKKWMYVIEDTISIIYLSVTWIKYVTSYIFESRIKLIYEQIAADWKSLIDEEEIQILNNYSAFARLLTVLYVFYAIIATTLFYVLPFLTIVIDRIKPLENGTRFRAQPYHQHYFDLIDNEKYYYHMYIGHGYVVSIIVTVAVMAIDTMYAANIQHACGLFAIVRHRLSKIGILNGEREYEFRVVDDKKVYESIRAVCEMHKNSIKIVELIWDSFSISFLIFMGCSLVGMGMLMFNYIFNMIHPIEKVVGTGLLLGIAILLFYMNWIAQQLTNSSDEIFIAVYSNRWYNLSIKGQKLIYSLLQSNANSVTLRAGGIAEMNLQQFAAILKTAMSYATVMMSMNG